MGGGLYTSIAVIVGILGSKAFTSQTAHILFSYYIAHIHAVAHSFIVDVGEYIANQTADRAAFGRNVCIVCAKRESFPVTNYAANVFTALT